MHRISSSHSRCPEVAGKLNTKRTRPNVVRMAVRGANVRAYLEHLERLSETRFSREQELLLCNSGSTEQVLRAIYGEVTFRVLRQRETPTKILRESEILDSTTGAFLIRASAVIRKSSFDNDFLGKVLAKQAGIGSILLTSGIDHRRRIFQVGYDYSYDCPFRTYWILCGRNDRIKIMELVLPRYESDESPAEPRKIIPTPIA